MPNQYFEVSNDTIAQIKDFAKHSSPIIRTCMVPLEKLMDGGITGQFANVLKGGYLREEGYDTNPEHARAHNAYLSQKREQVDKDLPIIFQAASENNWQQIVDTLFPKIYVPTYRTEMVKHLAQEQDANVLYDFLSYSYKSMNHDTGMGFVLRDMGFNGIATHKGADAQLMESALMNEPMKELITRNTPNSLMNHYAQMCELIRK